MASPEAVSPTQLFSGSFISLSSGLLSNVPFSMPDGCNIYGVGAGHPFGDYWPLSGGIEEVIVGMPDEKDAKVLVDRFFECVDPIYPMIHRQTFFADYAGFWAARRRQARGGQPYTGSDSAAEPDFVGLMLIIMALGVQFMPTSATFSPDTKQNVAKFYASSCNQALRVFSYLNTASIWSIQTMVLVVYYLINDNHCSDGWAFAGILTRQAFAMGLHRDPNIGK